VEGSWQSSPKSASATRRTNLAPDPRSAALNWTAFAPPPPSKTRKGAQGGRLVRAFLGCTSTKVRFLLRRNWPSACLAFCLVDRCRTVGYVILGLSIGRRSLGKTTITTITTVGFLAKVHPLSTDGGTVCLSPWSGAESSSVFGTALYTLGPSSKASRGSSTPSILERRAN